jgi:iron complex transport system substrate-binding protein
MGRIVWVLPLLLSACTVAPVRDDSSTHLGSVEGPTIVSLNPCTDAILAEVVDPGQLLAISSYSHNPASSSMDPAVAARFPATNGTVEEVFALQPDLVIDGNYTAPATKTALTRLGLRLEQLPIAPTADASLAQVRHLAALAGHPERGEMLVRRIEAALAAAASPGPPVSAVVWQSGGIVAGQGTLIDDLLRRTGFINLATARGLGQAEMLPLEVMLAEPPRVIFAAGNARANEDRLLRHPALAGLSSTTRARLDPALLWCGGPTIVRAAERLAVVRRSL